MFISHVLWAGLWHTHQAETVPLSGLEEPGV